MGEIGKLNAILWEECLDRLKTKKPRLLSGWAWR